MKGAPVSGTCRHCGCTEVDPCKLPCGDACMWLDGTRTVCNAPRCIVAEQARVSLLRAERAKPRSRFAELLRAGYGYGAAARQVRSESRKRRRGSVR